MFGATMLSMCGEPRSWEMEITDVFCIAGRAGVAVVGRWLVEGEIQSGAAAVVIHRGRATRIDGVGVELLQPESGVALFLPGRTIEDVVPGDRPASLRARRRGAEH